MHYSVQNHKYALAIKIRSARMDAKPRGCMSGGGGEVGGGGEGGRRIPPQGGGGAAAIFTFPPPDRKIIGRKKMLRHRTAVLGSLFFKWRGWGGEGGG
jgi:hypothetical protein